MAWRRENTSQEVEPETSIVWVRALLDAVLRRGFDRDALFRETQVTPSELADSRVRIPLSRWRALVRRALSLTQEDALGLRIGGSIPESVLQIAGQVALASETLRDALQVLERYRSLLGDARLCSLIEEGERAYIVHTPARAIETALVRFDAELRLSLIYRVSLHLAGWDGAGIHEIWFAHPAPAYASRYREVFHRPVHFDRPTNAVVLERSRLDRRQPYADRWLVESLQGCAERMLMESRAPSLPDQVRTLLRHEVDLRGVDAARVAGFFQLDARQLRHHLIRSDARWSLLVDEARREIACAALRRGDTSLCELSDRLGFSDQSAFNRAFKRWTGMPPARYRRRARATAGERDRGHSAQGQL